METSMETGTRLRPNNFSSIARRLLLNRESHPVSQMPSTSYDVHRTETHVDEVGALAIVPLSVSWRSAEY
ncbi:hypothetical protein Aduo_017306 [Ancylostoma duodenale]